MREIKFRAKRVDNGEWVYGDLIKNSIVDCFTYIAKGIGYKVDDEEIGKPIKVIPTTVGQYTGLKDDLSKEIYDGDILQICTYQYDGEPELDEYENVIVYFDNTGACLAIEYPYGDYDMTAVGWALEYFNAYGHDYNIIGNIHDNPEKV